jgi:hypothetical protein
MSLELLEMNPDVLMAAASKGAGGLTDFGGDEFREPLAVLIDSLQREAYLTPQGLYGWQQRTLQLLTHRLRLQELIRLHPEILAEPIERPLMIVGLQRTGTTKLQKVMACDPQWNAPFLWEALFPVPFPDEKPGDPSPRIEAARAWEKMFYGAIPEAVSGHAMFAEEVEEETFAMEMSFRWTVPSTFGTVPSYLRWVETHTAVPTYRDLRRILQLWQWRRGNRKPWLLKAPWHIGFLSAIVEVFPDITIVQTHRDPLQSVASNSALMFLGVNMSRAQLDKREHGRNVLQMNGRHMRMHMQQRAALARDPTIDVMYKDTVSDAVGVVRRIYAARGQTLSADVENRIRDWERDNAQFKHGKFHYTAEEYGLDRAAVTAEFRAYCERFGFPLV